MDAKSQAIAELLLKNNIHEDWGEIAHLNGKECSMQVANRFLLCCLLDWQWDSKVAWARGAQLAAALEKLNSPKGIWASICGFSKEEWKSKYEYFGKPHRYHKGFTRLWGIAVDLCARYDGDARIIWQGRPASDALLHLLALGAGEQISRMIVGALRDSKQIEGDWGDVKADVHLRRVLGRVMQGEEIKANDAAIVFQLTRNLCPDPWRLDLPLWSVGKTFCDPTNPKCAKCYLQPHCTYALNHGRLEISK